MWKKAFSYGSLALAITVLLTSAALAQDYTVGVSPSKIDLGELQPGEQKLVTFSIVTTSNDTMLVGLSAEPDRMDMAIGRFGQQMANYSEQDATPWVNIMETPVELKPMNEALSTAAGMIRGWRPVNFVIGVPANAEPGLHSLYIRPTPTTADENLGQVGAKLVAVTPILVYFNVSGTAVRSGEVVDITQGASNANSISIDTRFLNTGDTTMTATGSVAIFDENDSLVASANTASSKTGPGKTQTLTASFPTDKVVPSQYKVVSNVSYITGIATKTMFLSLSAPTPTGKVSLVTPQAYMPTWALIIAALVFIGAATYFIRRRG